MRPIDDLREKIDLWKKSTTDTALMSVLHDVLIQIDAAIYEMDHQEAKARGARWRNRRMSDPIDRGDVLGVISCFFKDNDIDGLADLEREINRLDAASPWHRVEDDYPDLLQFVVVCNDDGKCVVAQYVGYQTDSLTPWRIAYTMYDTDIYDEKECGPVRYWMPIEPPKEDA